MPWITDCDAVRLSNDDYVWPANTWTQLAAGPIKASVHTELKFWRRGQSRLLPKRLAMDSRIKFFEVSFRRQGIVADDAVNRSYEDVEFSVK
jgi:hypothetical protein